MFLISENRGTFEVSVHRATLITSLIECLPRCVLLSMVQPLQQRIHKEVITLLITANLYAETIHLC